MYIYYYFHDGDDDYHSIVVVFVVVLVAVIGIACHIVIERKFDSLFYNFVVDILDRRYI